MIARHVLSQIEEIKDVENQKSEISDKPISLKSQKSLQLQELFPVNDQIEHGKRDEEFICTTIEELAIIREDILC